MPEDQGQSTRERPHPTELQLAWSNLWRLLLLQNKILDNRAIYLSRLEVLNKKSRLNSFEEDSRKALTEGVSTFDVLLAQHNFISLIDSELEKIAELSRQNG